MAAEILKKHEKEFFRVINAKVGLRTLVRRGVITENVKKEIDASNSLDAREILYDYLRSHANVDELKEFCEVAIAAEGFPNMQAFGEKLKKELSTGESPANQQTDAAQSQQSSNPDCVQHQPTPRPQAVTAEQVLYKFQERFIDNVDADSIVKELKRKHIISDYVSDGINSFSNPMYQSQFLHAQLVKRCTAEALRDVCDILVSVEGNPKMRSLGKDMKKMLQGSS